MDWRCGLVFAVLLFAHLSAVEADTVQGCGGFVEPSAALLKLRNPWDPKLDYSHTTVELQTLDGLVKDRTQCAPNGYYFLPVYDKGAFILKINGQDGWSFESHQVTVVLGQDACKENDDINFRYTGFSMSGRVLGAARGSSCPAGNQGPAGVRVVLVPGKGEDTLPKSITVMTSKGGFYKFENLPPGQYILEASHPRLQVELTGDSKVELAWKPYTVDDIFHVPGYVLGGSVVSQGNPVLGVEFYLFSVEQAHCPQRSTFPPRQHSAACYAISDEAGQFLFSNVPCGQYHLVPYYRGRNTIFDVSPSLVDVAIHHESVTLPNPFQVTGFSVAGRVVRGDGTGVGDAKIYVTDVLRATSDSQGYYKLDQVTSIYYTIRAEKTHYSFGTLENFLVLPNMASIPDIVATHYNVCGVIESFLPAVDSKHYIQLTHGPVDVKPQTKKVDDKGLFCFEVPQGEYRLSVLPDGEERVMGVLFSPPFLDVSVNSPVLNILFTQAQVSIAGTVKCKAGCSPRVAVSLTPSVKTHSSETESARLSFVDSTGGFKFDGLFPGKYILEVTHQPSSDVNILDDEWCWEQKQLRVEVGTDDLVGLTFVQKGFWMPVKSTHAVEALIRHPNRGAVSLKIKRGWQQECLETSGVHELFLGDACVSFGGGPFTYDTDKSQPLILVGEKYLLRGQMHIDSRLYPHANKLRSISLDVQQAEGIMVGPIKAYIVSEANESHPVAIFHYTHLAEMGDKLTFAPRYARHVTQQDVHAVHTELDGVLFYPLLQQVHVKVDACQPEIPTFHGRPGVLVRGSISPALEGVGITVIANEDSSVGSLKVGDIAFRTSTTQDGMFTAGPLFDETTYSVIAEKAGYYFKPLGNNAFACHQLGQIRVSIVPGDGAERQLPEVLLSLSGDDGYRKNAATARGGVLTFENLFPGSFFLRPFLKEYKFSPAAAAIEVRSGETNEVDFLATRIAYSALGVVTSLNGRPEEGVFLEARSHNGEYYEETMTGAEGKFRLRGLSPHTNYSLQVISKGDRRTMLKVERAVPVSVTLEVTNEDIVGVNFVVFEQAETAVMMGVAEGRGVEGTWQPHLVAEAMSILETDKVETRRLPAINYFEFKGLPNGRYVVRLVSDLPGQTHDFGSDVIEVDLQHKNFVQLEPIRFLVKNRLHKAEIISAPVLPIVAAMVVMTFVVTIPRVREVYHAIAGGGTSTAAAQKKEVKKTTLRKRA